MSDRIDRILELIDGGLLDNSRQSSPEPAMPLDGTVVTGFMEYDYDAPELGVRVHECGPECEEHAHIAAGHPFGERMAANLAGWIIDHLDQETVYVRLHTSDPVIEWRVSETSER